MLFRSHEFLLPSHALDKKGKLIPITYEITNKKVLNHKMRDMVSVDDGESVITETEVSVMTHIVKPNEEFMFYDPDVDGDFSGYEERYLQMVCQHNASSGYAWLYQICAKAERLNAYRN